MFTSKKITIAITYAKVTPESAVDGDFSDHGYEEETRPYEQGDLKSVQSKYYFNGLRKADSTNWWTTESQVEDYSTDETVEYNLHIAGVTKSTRNRINKLISNRSF